VLIAGLTLIFFFLDFFLKQYISAHLAFNTPYPLIGEIVQLRVVHNTGVAFGLLQGKTAFVIAAGVLFILFFVFFILKEKHTLPKKIFLSMILGGALCNLYDRVFLGYVVDYIDLGWWPVFNLSDSLISVGCVLMVISYLIGHTTHDTRRNISKGDSHLFSKEKR
jgi:signal peptidase II